MQNRELNYRSSLTVLTDTIPPVHTLSYKVLRGIFRCISRKKPIWSPYPGHEALTKGLLSGLQKNQIPTIFNPSSQNQLSSHVHVLCGQSPLKQALRWKQEGRIETISAGPVICISPLEIREILENNDIQTVLLPSFWTYQYYTKQLPSIEKKCKIWAAGINTEDWIPATKNQNRQIVLYDKQKDPSFLSPYIAWLRSLGWHPILIRYGRYTQAIWQKVLQQASCAVFFSQSESQGLALLEAWAMDIPSFVWDPRSVVLNNQIIASSAAPYLTNQTGKSFTSLEEFQSLFLQWEQKLFHFSPRIFVQKHFTDILCAQTFLKTIGFSYATMNERIVSK